MFVVTMVATLFLFAGCSGGSSGGSTTNSIKGEDGKIEMSAKVDKTKVDVTVRLKENCGINAMDLVLDYDTKVLTLTGVDEGTALKSLDLITTNTNTEKGYSITPFKFSYLNANKNDTSTGTMFTLHFSVKKNADVKKTTVGLKYTKGDITSLTDKGVVSRSFAVIPASVALA